MTIWRELGYDFDYYVTNTEGLKDAIGKADAAGGGVIFLEAGVYNGNEIDLPLAVGIVGEDKATVITFGFKKDKDIGDAS